jgi:LysM repeat protein
MGAYRPTGLRMLAPISLVAFAVVFLIVIVSSLDGGSDSKSKSVRASAQRTEKRATGGRRTRTANTTGTTGATGASGATGAFANRRVYVVRAGDTLVEIADRTGVPIEELLSLNPSIDPQGLVTGQRVKLRE